MSLIGSEKPVKVEVRSVGGGYSLFRDGKPFFVKGAGGFQHVEQLARFGGNSVRTWGIEQTEQALPAIRQTGISLCAGLWMVPPRKGFDYTDPIARSAQFEQLKQQVLQLKSEPSLLVWGVGNELELGDAADDSVWQAVEEVACFIKEVDPLHPVMTVLSAVREDALLSIEQHCPSLDFVSFNSYGDVEKVQSKLEAVGWRIPYLVTEWGPTGHWESAQTRWGAEIEPTSSEKAAQIGQRFRSLDGSRQQCLGSYVFLWGNKQETTPTWYGLFSPEGRVTESVETIAALWKGKTVNGVSPRIGAIHINGHRAEESLTLTAGEQAVGRFELWRGEPTLGDVRWSVYRESTDKKIGGDEETAPPEARIELACLDTTRTRFSVPSDSGPYRLFLEVFGPNNTVATANFPFWVEA